MAAWAATTLVEDLLSERALKRRGWFDPAAVARLVAADQYGRTDAAYSILAVLCMELWAKIFLDRQLTVQTTSVATVDSGMEDQKQAVRDFWDAASCGENLYLQGETRESYQHQARQRYELEPYIIPFADFAGSGGKRVLEIGLDWVPTINVLLKLALICTESI